MMFDNITTDQTLNFSMKAAYCEAVNTTVQSIEASLQITDLIIPFNAVSSDGYYDASAAKFTFEKGSSYQVGYHHSRVKSAVWVDWNNDFAFDESEKTDLVYNGSHEHPFANVTIWGAGDIAFVVVPQDAHEGDVRLRIRAFSDAADEETPCGAVEGSVTIDATITVIATGQQEPSYGGGKGTEELPHLILTPEHLQTLGGTPQHWSRCFKLGADIDMSYYGGHMFNVIGNHRRPFVGTFDGDDHVISNFRYNTLERSRIGLFGNIGEPALIENVHLVDPDVHVSRDSLYDAGGEAVAAIVGVSNENTTIRNCSVRGGSITGVQGVAPIAGLSYGTISQCRADSTVSGHAAVAGLVGVMDGSALTEECFARGTVTAYDMFPEAGNAKPIDMWIRAAGFVSDLDEGTVRNCYAAVDVWSSRDVCGFADYVAADAIVENCYSASTLHNLPGWAVNKGFFTKICDGASTSCYWDSDVVGDAPGSSYSGCAAALTTGQMHQQASFVGWDFDLTWRICEGSNYPRLQLETPLGGDFRCPEGVELSDLLALSEHWLSTDDADYDIAPGPEGDGVVDMLDFVVLARHWMLDTE
jgi:hypothetical protein